MRVLIVEDDPKIARFVARGLEQELYQVDIAEDGTIALARLRDNDYDLVVLDLMLPGSDGFEVLRFLRSKSDKTTVIILSARGDIEDRVKGLDLGADDYLVKPFSFVELLARIRAHLRRRDVGDDLAGRIPGLVVDRINRKLSRAGTTIDLTAREFQLFDYLVRHVGQTLTRAMIADRVWGYQFDSGTNVIDVYVNYLRKKIQSGLGLKVEAVRGVGYRLVVEDEAPACP